MNKPQPHIKIFNHYKTRDLERFSPERSFVVRFDGTTYTVEGTRQKEGPGTPTHFDSYPKAMEHFNWLIKEYES